MKIFAERELSDFLEEHHRKLREEVQSADKNYLLNVNETQYVDYLVKHYRIEPLVLHWEQRSISDREKMIPAEEFPFGFYVNRGRCFSKQVITYHIPYSGEEQLLRCLPSMRIGWTMDVQLEGGCVCLDVVNWRDDAEEIKREEAEILRHMQQQLDNVTREVDQYNGQLENEVRQIVQVRKNLLLKQSNLMASLGVPFHRTGEVPLTFSVPVIEKKIIVKPSAPSSAYTPEPTLDYSTYQDILQIIHETGKVMERHPSIYRGKDEEALRDHFIMVLSPHFQSVTGETFNKTGKTDILIRHERQNVFVAECKFWKGVKSFYETIDQLFGYLTWRDSKSAIICFIVNKELNPVLEQIEKETANHSCFVKYKGKTAESWFNFEFHLKNDNTRNVHLAMLCFHFP